MRAVNREKVYRPPPPAPRRPSPPPQCHDRLPVPSKPAAPCHCRPDLGSALGSALGAVFLALAPNPAHAQAPVAPENAGFNLWQSASLLGDAGGLRPQLAKMGATFSLGTTLEMARNPSGGRSQGHAANALTSAALRLDTDTAFGLAGGLVNVSALWIEGQGITATHVGAVNTVSNIEATPALRLFEAYYDQSFAQGRVSLRLGQLAADQEFLTTAAGVVLINSSFGWPTLAAANLPAGGPAYPVATPGVRLSVQPGDQLVLRAGVYNGNPSPEGFGDPQILNPAGTSFRTNGGLFAIAEIEASGALCGASAAHPAVCKLGAWYENHPVNDLRYDAGGVSLADFNGTGVPRRYWSNDSVYASMERDIAHLPGTARPLSLLARIMASPGDRNFLSVFADAALVAHAPFATRPLDSAALGAGFAQASAGARGIASDLGRYDGLPQIPRANEVFVEATYQAFVAPWWSVQPDIQYIMSPGGGMGRNDNPDRRAGNALVVMLRTAITF